MQRTALTLFSTDPLRPTEAVFGQRQRANSIAGGSKNGVADGGQNRRKSRLAQPRGRIVRLQKMHFNFRRDLRHAHRRVRVEVALDRAPSVDCYLVSHDVTHSFDDCALRLIDGIARIDDLVADVARHPYLIDLHPAFRVNANLGHLCKITAMREMEPHAHTGTLSRLA